MERELPQVERPLALTERADAARNRRRILDAAGALLDERGIDGVSMHDVARAACVGTGTLYRRFGDRAGLALAVLEDSERAFQDAVLRGPPPLGPGAPARERLCAFGHRYLEHLDEHADLIAAAQAGGPLLGGPFTMYRTHLAVLLDEAGADVDVDYTVEALLASLGARQHLHARSRLGWPLERLQAGWADHVEAWLACGRAGAR